MKFSLIIPVYNVAPYLRECLDSCLAQDIPATEYEIIAVNDGSTDKSPAILREYEAAHPNRFVIIDQPNAGLGPTRNAGFAASRGEYIWFIDSDDAIRKNSLAALLAALERTGAEILRMKILPFTGSLQAAEAAAGDGVFAATPSSPAKAVCMFTGSACDKIFSRNLLLRTKMEFPALRMFEDNAEVFRVMAQARNIVKSDVYAYFYRQRRGSLLCTFNERKMLDTIRSFEMIQSQILLFPEIRSEYEYCFWRLLRWAIKCIEESLSDCDAESRAAIAAHLPKLKTMFAAINPANPYINLVEATSQSLVRRIQAYENSMSWRITAPLRFLLDMALGIKAKFTR